MQMMQQMMQARGAAQSPLPGNPAQMQQMAQMMQMMQARAGQASSPPAVAQGTVAQGGAQTSDATGAQMQLMMRQMGENVSMMSPETETMLAAKYQDEAEDLNSMGFENRKACLWALAKHDGNMEKAVDELSDMNEAALHAPAQETAAVVSFSYDECEVVAHVYDISGGMASSTSQMMAGLNMELLPHTGIVVLGKEHSFTHEATVSEIGKSLPSHVKKVVKLGKTSKSRAELEVFLESLKTNWTAASYVFLTNNSNHYADAVAKFLLDGNGLPADLLSLQEQLNSNPQGQQLAQMLSTMETNMRMMRQGGSMLTPTGPVFHGGTPADPASQGMMQNMMGGMGGQSAQDAQRAQQRLLFQAQLVQLGSMGFGDEALNLRALSQSQGNVEAALNFIIAAGHHD